MIGITVNYTIHLIQLKPKGNCIAKFVKLLFVQHKLNLCLFMKLFVFKKSTIKEKKTQHNNVVIFIFSLYGKSMPMNSYLHNL